MLEADVIMAPPRLPVLAGQTAVRVAAALVRLFDELRDRADKLQWVVAAIVAEPPSRDLAPQVPDPATPRQHRTSIHRACIALAAAIDDDAGRLDRHAYHNRQHFCEVTLTAHVLAQLNGLDAEAHGLVVLAALIHDIAHDTGPGLDFRNERASIEHARPLLAAAGLAPAVIERLAALVLATETIRGTPFMAAALRVHDGAQGAPGAAPALAPELALLLDDAALARQARLLCAADVLPSIGLTPEHAMHLQHRLAREWGRPLGAGDKLAFIAQVLGQGLIDDFFLPNVEATRRAVIAFRHAPAHG